MKVFAAMHTIKSGGRLVGVHTLLLSASTRSDGLVVLGNERRALVQDGEEWHRTFFEEVESAQSRKDEEEVFFVVRQDLV